MNNLVEDTLASVEGYLLSINRDTENGWYELEVGIPSSWVFRGSKTIDCTNIVANDEFKMVKVSPFENGVRIPIDELIEFVSTIVATNLEIEAKENGFNQMLEQEKLALQEKAKAYYNELEALKEKSFTNFDEKDSSEPVKKRSYKKHVASGEIEKPELDGK